MKEELFLDLTKDQTIGVLAITIPIIGYLITKLYQRWFVGARLVISMKLTNFVGRPDGVVDAVLDEEGFIDRHKSTVVYNLNYKYDMSITNNSDKPAYFTRIVFQTLDSNKPIQAGETLVLKVEINENHKSLPTKRKNSKEKPIAMEELQILLIYQNLSKSRFYTLYKVIDEDNTFSQFEPKFK